MSDTCRNIPALLGISCVIANLFLAGCTDSISNMPVDTALQTILDRAVAGSGVKGVSAAVIFSDGVVWQGASGVSHEGAPVTTDMMFDIGSIEKNFQAALTLKLVEENLLGLDDPIEKWLPHYPNIDGRITVRQLLNMTSGLDKIVDDPNSPWKIGYRNIDFDKVWNWTDICDSFITVPNFEPGTKCEYSTTNYIVLKHIIETVTQSKQATEFKNRVLQPFELTHTLLDVSQPTLENQLVAHGWCDADNDGVVDDISVNSLAWLASLSPMLVYSTPGDMAKWIDALLHRKTVLRTETLEAMLAFRGPVMNEPMMNGYGLGLADINLGALMPKWRDIKVYGHLGSQFGYTTFAGYFPDLEISIAIMFNRGCDRETDRATGAVAKAFFDTLFRRLGARELNEINSVSDMEDELKKTPDDIHLMHKIATMYRTEGDNNEALRMYEMILKDDPDNMFGYEESSLFWEACLVASIKSEPDKLRSFIENHGNYGDIQFAYKNLAETYKRRNEIAKAITLYKEAVKEFKGDAYFLNHVAWWLFENKIESEYGTAVEYAEEATNLMPRECSIWDTRAQLYNVTGQRQKALEASERALSLAPVDRREEYQGYLDKIKGGK